MRVLYFDCFSGISGDMAVGALLDLGVDQELFKAELSKLKIDGYEIIVEKKVRNGISGTDFQVVLHDGHPNHAGHERRHSGGGTAQAHMGHNSAGHGTAHTGHRSLRDIEEILEKSGLKRKVKEFSLKAFGEIAKAEARVHGKDIYEIHFHEVGAVDTIIDIVGTAVCIDLLGVQKVFSSALHDGKGFIECQHGILPVPVPAVMEMLAGSGIPIVTEDVGTELITPTGMAIVKCLASGFGNMPAMIVDRIGYGFGKRETGRFNGLRAVLGTLFGEDTLMEEIAVLETNIDDLSPEILGFVMEQLFEHGALDVFYTPVHMKKNRPAVMLTVISSKDREAKMVDIILRQTSTLGIRRSLSGRYRLDRDTVRVETRYGEVRVKVASYGDYIKYAPEYEDCREIALRTGIPIISIYNDACSKMGERTGKC